MSNSFAGQGVKARPEYGQFSQRSIDVLLSHPYYVAHDGTTQEAEAGWLKEGYARYWVRETRDEWHHRHPSWVWLQGSVNPSSEQDTPVVLDWDFNAIDSKDHTTWPPAETWLSDLVVYKILKAKVPQRARASRWPKVFQTAGDIVSNRVNIGPAANEVVNGVVRDIVFKQAYILHGDLGARGLHQSATPQLTGLPSRSFVGFDGKKHVFTTSKSESAYDLTTETNMYLPPLMPRAIEINSGITPRAEQQEADNEDAASTPTPLPKANNAVTSLSISQSSQPSGTSTTPSTATTVTAQGKIFNRLWLPSNLPWLRQRFSGYTAHQQVHETPRPCQQDDTQSVKSLPSAEVLHHSSASGRVNLGTRLRNTLQVALEPCETTLKPMVEATGFVWGILRWPVTVIGTLVIGAMVVIWVVALGYTFTSNAFLNSFCEMKLPLIREMVCSEYDATLKQMLQQTATTDFNEKFGTMFEDKNIDTAISLPYYLNRWQTEIRWLRSNLPGAKLSEWDEQFFRETLTESIDLNKDTVILAQKTFAHMHGTVEYIVSGIASVMGSLEETGFTAETLSLPENPGDNLLTIGMKWLQSKHVVYLPYGVEPFQEPRAQPMLTVTTCMRVFFQGVIERLRIDQDGLLTLRGQLDSQIDICDRLTTEAVRCVSNEEEAKVLRGRRGWFALLDLIGLTDPKEWVTQKRLQGLESMKPVYQAQSDYLGKASVQIGSALQACESLEENLFAQQVAIRRGMSPSEWLFKQPKVLEEGKEKMAKELNVWNMRKTELNARIFESFE